MEGSDLNLSALKGKIFDKLSAASSKSSGASNKKAPAKNGKKDEKPSKKGRNEKPSTKAKDEKPSNHTTPKTEKKGENTKANSSKSSTPKPEQDNASNDADDADDVLRREALSFGASEADLKLVQGLSGKEDNIPENPKSDKSLASDVSSFISSLGLTGQSNDADTDGELSDEEVPNKVQDEGKEETKNARKLAKQEAKQAKRNEKKAQKEERKEQKRQEREQREAEEAAKQAAKEEKPAVDQPQTAVIERKKNADKVDDIRSVQSNKLRIETRVDWYNCEVPAVDEPVKCDRFAVERLTDRAQALLDSENRVYLEEFASNNSQKKFLSQILSDGTLNDKISALTLLVQEAPLHNIKAFDTLMGYCEKKSRTASLQAINAMKDLFLNGLLPDRKLTAFNKQALSNDAKDETLALYLFEDHLKKSYFRFIQVLEHLTHDPILHVKMTVVTHIFDLLKGKPEQEANLLRLGVNKLGDIENKVSAKASYQILQLEEAHPAMKRIITDAITDLIFQKQNEHHAQYYTVLTLNQTVFLKSDTELANTLVKTYFSLFEKILVESDGANGEIDKLGGDKTLGKSDGTRKNLRRGSKKGKNGGKSVKVQEKTAAEVAEEKNSKLFSAILTGLNRALPFCNLPAETYMGHLNTLYKITHSTNFNTSVQALILVQQIVSQQKLDADRYYRTLYESLLDPRLVSSSKQGIYLNLLYKSLKSDTGNASRVLSFVKRMLQICSHWINVGSITGMFFLLMELSKIHPQILELMEPVEGRSEAIPAEESNEYDPKKRDPKYAGAQNSCFWEMTQFTNHYHPTVAIYANSLLDGTAQPKPDLGLYTLAHFLDKFVYRNVKQKTVLRGSSIMQPLGGSHLQSLLVKASNGTPMNAPANSIDWLSRRADEIQADDKFFYDYFLHNKNKIRNSETKEKAVAHDDEEDPEAEVWDALVKSNPELEVSDEDDGFSDMNDEDFGDMSDDEEELTAEQMAQLDGVSDIDEEGFDEDGAEPASDGDDAEIFDFNDEDELASDEETDLTDAKRPRDDDQDGKKSKRKKLSNLPTFASAEDYAQYLQSDEEEF